MPKIMVEAEGLSKYFDSFCAVDQITLKVPEGEILVLLGPNGAGKTTTVRMLTSILQPSLGSAKVAGFDVNTQADQVRANVGVLTEHHGLYVRMNAREYLGFFGSLYSIPQSVANQRMEELLIQFGLGDVGKKRLGEYSKGMRQKLALVRTLLHDPPVILLDEPTSAMDPESAYIVREAIKQLRSKDRTIILCTHNLKEAEELADQIAIIRRGKIILQGQLSEIRKNLIGAPEFRVNFTDPDLVWNPDGQIDLNDSQSGNGWFKYRTENPYVDNPLLISLLVKSGIQFSTLEEIHYSLEELYLKTVSLEGDL